MRPNRLRAALQREPCETLGTRVYTAAPGIVELIGHTGAFDYVEFLAEPAPFDLFALENLCRAAELHDLSAIIKIEQTAVPFLAQRAVGAGFQGVLFADARSARDVERAIEAVRPDTPDARGIYGATGRRMADPGGVGTPEYVAALNDIVILVMIEKGSAVADLDNILAVAGVDLVQFGPVDYAMSLGRPGDANTPSIREVERSVIRAAIDAGIQPRAELTSVEDAEYYLELGVRHFALGTDVSILHAWWSSQGHRLRETMRSVFSE
jgi:2-keto-3-deoxy-L-rhamnonate aldolase RhmA